MSWMPGLGRALAASAVLAAASTLGDWIWTRFLPDGAVLPGIVHGALVFLILAMVLALAIGTRTAWRRLTISLPVAGLLIAAAFYPLAELTASFLAALLVCWAAMWLTISLLLDWAREGQGTRRGAAARGVVAAVGSGVAFWAVSAIWTVPHFDPGYPLRFLCWTVAFLPGFVALMVSPRRR